MCSSCGKAAAALRAPGASPRNALVIGDANGKSAQPATFLVDTDQAPAGKYLYVTGDGVDAAVEAGTIALGYQPRRAAKAAAPAREPSTPQWYVQIGRNRWRGFANKNAAERFAASVGETVKTRDEVATSG